MNSEILVSVICLAFNHEKYIRKALDGFVSQETTFQFEVLIHDDASTDGTADIIRQYHQKWPNIIKPIFQTDNQYSKGIPITRTILLPHAKGKYVAFCEGDDFWTDPLKLQKQAKFLEANPEYVCCTHGFLEINNKSGHTKICLNEESKEYTLEEVVDGGGAFFATASIMMSTKFLKSKPDFYNIRGFGDYQLVIYAAASGRLYHIQDVMCAYNMFLPHSWTALNYIDLENRKQHLKKLFLLLRNIDKGYDYKYTKIFETQALKKEYEYHTLDKNYRELRSCKYLPLYKYKSFKGKIGMLLNSYAPKLMPLILRIYKVFTKGEKNG